ncbi:MAG: hypothetical protein ACLVJH_08210 [Faecalibacterium prausnitzii]
MSQLINQEQTRGGVSTCRSWMPPLSEDWDGAAMALQHHLELARDKAEGVIKVIRLW